MNKMKIAFDIADELRKIAEKIESLGMAIEPKKPEPKETVTLEMVRALLAQKAQEGKRVAVKALITKYGAEKLTDVPPDQYANLFKEAEGL